MRLRSVSSLCGLFLVLGAAAPAIASATEASPRIPADDRMFPGGQLTEGQSMTSASSEVWLELSGGELSLRAGCNTILWSPPVTGINSVVYSRTGVIKLKDAQGRVLASFGGPKAHPKRLVVQNDGNLVATAAKGWYFQTDTRWPLLPANGVSQHCF